MLIGPGRDQKVARAHLIKQNNVTSRCADLIFQRVDRTMPEENSMFN